MQLLCDEMLKRLGRWLRAAGYDTVIADAGIADRDLLARARREGRYLITRDRKLLEHAAAPGTVVLLGANTVEGCAGEVTERLGIDWQSDPFTRCLVCNQPLERAGPDLHRCAACDRHYWEGSHVRRMRARLRRWNAGPEPRGDR